MHDAGDDALKSDSHLPKKIVLSLLDWKPFKMMKNVFHDVTTWFTNNSNTHISQSKGNQTMKFGQLIEHNTRNIFLQKLWGKLGRVASSRPLYFFKKLNMRWKQVVCSLVSICFDSLQLPIQSKQTVYKILGYWSRDTLNFHFSEKGLGLVTPPHFVYDFSRKKFRVTFY